MHYLETSVNSDCGQNRQQSTEAAPYISALFQTPFVRDQFMLNQHWSRDIQRLWYKSELIV